MCGIRCQERRPFGNRLWRLEQVLVILVSHSLADPISYPAGRDREANLKQRLKQLGGGVMGAVLVADNDCKRDLAVGRHASFGIGFVEEGVHALENALGNALRLPEPDRRADHQDVGRQDAVAKHRPCIAIAFVRRYPRALRASSSCFNNRSVDDFSRPLALFKLQLNASTFNARGDIVYRLSCLFPGQNPAAPKVPNSEGS